MSSEVVQTLIDGGGTVALIYIFWTEMRRQTNVLRSVEKCLAILVDRVSPIPPAVERPIEPIPSRRDKTPVGGIRRVVPGRDE